MNALYLQLKETVLAFWTARTEQERRFLSIGGTVVLLALVYAIFIDPALTGRAKLRQALPQQHQEAALMQAMAAEARDLAQQPTQQVAPIAREAIMAGLVARGITPESLTVAGDAAKLQVKDASYASLAAWLDAQRRESRIVVVEAKLTGAAAKPGTVDGTLTLRQNNGEAR